MMKPVGPLVGLTLAEEKCLNINGANRQKLGCSGTLFIRKNSDVHPIAKVYSILKQRHEHEAMEVTKVTQEDLKLLALAIIEARTLKILKNVIAVNTIVKEVQDECNLLVHRSSLLRMITTLECGKDILPKGRPELFSSELLEILKNRLETRRLKTGSIRKNDIYNEARALSVEQGFTFHASSSWMKKYLKSRNAKQYSSSKGLEIVRSLKAQPEHGYFF
jgi:hypothetical protein